MKPKLKYYFFHETNVPSRTEYINGNTIIVEHYNYFLKSVTEREYGRLIDKKYPHIPKWECVKFVEPSTYPKRKYNYNYEPFNENGPTKIKYENNIIIYEQYTDNNGNWHREDGPARIEYYADGSIRQESYYKHGKRYRENGPWSIEYNTDGSIKNEYVHD